MTPARHAIERLDWKIIIKFFLTSCFLAGFVLWSPPSAKPLDIICTCLNILVFITWITRQDVIKFLRQQAATNREPVIQNYLAFAFGTSFSHRKERHCWYYTTSYDTMLSIYTMLQTQLQKSAPNRLLRRIYRFQFYLLTSDDVIHGIRVARHQLHQLPSCQRNQ